MAVCDFWVQALAEDNRSGYQGRLRARSGWRRHKAIKRSIPGAKTGADCMYRYLLLSPAAMVARTSSIPVMTVYWIRRIKKMVLFFRQTSSRLVFPAHPLTGHLPRRCRVVSSRQSARCQQHRSPRWCQAVSPHQSVRCRSARSPRRCQAVSPHQSARCRSARSPRWCQAVSPHQSARCQKFLPLRAASPNSNLVGLHWQDHMFLSNHAVAFAVMTRATPA